MKKLVRLLIANRGEIVVRIARTANAMGIETVAIYSDADGQNTHARACDKSVCIGGKAASESYLVIDKIIAAARQSGADAIHPGYGFLSENSEFAKAVEAAGLIFVGPPAAAIAAMGDKAAARLRMARAGIPITPGYDGDDQSEERFIEEARKIGFPVMIKASSGGGGRGIRKVTAASDFASALLSAASESKKAFGDGRLILERAVERPRHVEIQIFADSHGNVVHLGERDCSVQRRHQKVLEEAPSPAVDEELRVKMGEAAAAVAKAIGYIGAGTVEFLLDADCNFYFMEMNTRLQVEHPVTELVTGIDIVQEQIKIAAGEKLKFTQEEIHTKGAAIECRINAEDPDNNFMPSPGKIEKYLAPGGPWVRVDSHVYPGYVIPPFYDSMIAKVIVYAPHRHEAIAKMSRALSEMQISPVKTTIPLHLRIMNRPAFQKGHVNTGFIDKMMTQNQPQPK